MTKLRPTPVAVFIGLMLVLGTLLVYLPVRHHGFVSFDDPDYVTDNRMVQAGVTWAGVEWAFTTGHSSNWHPLTWLSHMLDAQLFGAGPTGPHMVNVLFHIANTLLLFMVLRRFTGALWRSALVAALFAWHPLRVESVAWVAERKDVLSAFFFLLTLWAYANYVEPPAGRNPKPRAWYGGALALFALGLMSKPMLVTLPFVLLLLDYWPLRRWEIVTWRRPFPQPARIVWEKVPFFALSAISCVVTFVVQRHGGAVRSLAGFSLGERMGNSLVSYERYLEKTFWPADLAVFYPHPGHWPTPQVGLAAILVAGLCLGALWWSRRFPFVATGWFWFLGMTIPTVGLIQVGEQSMADRYTYLPSIGVFVLLAWGAGEGFRRWRWPKAVVGIAAGLAVVACAARTAGQLRHWRNSESLFRHAIAVTGENFVAHNSLGFAFLHAGRVDEAIAEFRATLKIRPDFAEAHNNLGNALLQQGRLDDAMAHFKQALESRPGFALARCNLGIALLQAGRVDEAIVQLEKAVTIQPDDAEAHSNLGNALLQKGQVDEAIARYQKALEIQSDYADVHNNLGSALLQKGGVDEAIGHFQKALAIHPGHANARYNLGDAFLRQGRIDEAIVQLEKALEIQPDDAEAHSDLGFGLLRQGRVREAMAHYRAALNLQPDHVGALANLAWVLATCPDGALRNGAQAVALAQRASLLSGGQNPVMLRTLAAALAEDGKFAEAVATARRALELVDRQSDLALADALPLQIKLYQAGSPFRDTGQP